ncbi:MAG TPA: cytochrome c [Bryobacteraceae bacterium]
MISKYWAILIVTIFAFLAIPALAAPDMAGAKTIFKKRCTACHTFGKGIKVGPDLKGVTDRRTRDWLLRFISASSRLIQSREATAMKLFLEFKQERMPDWDDLSPEQIASIIDYFAANGPEQKEPDERHANTATANELKMGRDLFHRHARPASGVYACGTCHSIGARKQARHGSLGPDLTNAYLKYRDRALTDFLKQPCFQGAPELFTNRYLSPEESFALKAYMAQEAGVLAILARP